MDLGEFLCWHLKEKLCGGMGKAPQTCSIPGHPMSDPSSGSSAPSPANQGCRKEWEEEKGRKGGKQGGLGDFLLYNAMRI